MTVYINWVRRAHLRRQRTRQRLLLVLGFVIVMLILGRIRYLDDQARAQMNGHMVTGRVVSAPVHHVAMWDF